MASSSGPEEVSQKLGMRWVGLGNGKTVLFFALLNSFSSGSTQSLINLETLPSHLSNPGTTFRRGKMLLRHGLCLDYPGAAFSFIATTSRSATHFLVGQGKDTKEIETKSVP